MGNTAHFLQVGDFSTSICTEACFPYPYTPNVYPFYPYFPTNPYPVSIPSFQIDYGDGLSQAKDRIELLGKAYQILSANPKKNTKTLSKIAAEIEQLLGYKPE